MASTKKVLPPTSVKNTGLVILILNPQYGDSTFSGNAGNVYHTIWRYNSEDSNFKFSVIFPYNKFNENSLRRS
jgi:hypothetical protein